MTAAEREAYDARAMARKRKREEDAAHAALVWGPVGMPTPVLPWAIATVQLEMGGYRYRAEIPIVGAHLPLEDAAETEPLRLWRIALLEQIMARPKSQKDEAATARFWVRMHWRRTQQFLFHEAGNAAPNGPKSRKIIIALVYLILRSHVPPPAIMCNSRRFNQGLTMARHPEVLKLVDPVTGKPPVCPAYVRREGWAARYGERPIPFTVDKNNVRIPVHRDFAALVQAYDPADPPPGILPFPTNASPPANKR